MFRRIHVLHLAALLWAAVVCVHAQEKRDPLVRPVLTALVLPQLSLECFGAIGTALRVCSSPSPRAAMVCGAALVQVLHSCP